MRHTVTIIMALALGRIFSESMDRNDYETAVLCGVIAIGLGILAYLLAKKNVK